MELMGYTAQIVQIKNRRNKTIRTETKWETPEVNPKNKVSNTLNDLVFESYPAATLKKTAGATLQAIWREAIANTKSKNLRMFVDIFTRLQKLLELFYPSENTLATSTTAWREPLLKKYGKDSDIYEQSIHILGISRERSIARRKEYTAKVREATKKRGDVVKYTQDQIFSVIDACNSSNNPLDFIIAVCLCTGSRLIEVLRISAYSTVPDKPDYIKLTGIAKDKETRGVDAASTKVIVKPVVRLSPGRIVQMVQEIRAKWDFTHADNKKATAKMDGPVNRRLQDFFGKADQNLPESKKTTAHKLRHIYASLSYQLYGEPRGVAENEYIREVLGHDSNEVSVAYQNIVVDVPGSKRNLDKNLPSDIRYKLGEIEHDLKGNEEDHKEMKNDIKNVTVELDRQIANANLIDVEFPQFINPKRIRLSKAAKLDRLRKLDQALHDAGIRATQATFKRYSYGSSIIQEYYRHHRPEEFE